MEYAHTLSYMLICILIQYNFYCLILSVPFIETVFLVAFLLVYFCGCVVFPSFLSFLIYAIKKKEEEGGGS